MLAPFNCTFLAVSVPAFSDVPTAMEAPSDAFNSLAAREPLTATVPLFTVSLSTSTVPAACTAPAVLVSGLPVDVPIISSVVFKAAPSLTATVPWDASILLTVKLPASTFIWLSACTFTSAFKVPPLLVTAVLPKVSVPAEPPDSVLPTVTVFLELSLLVPFSKLPLPSPTNVSPVSLLILTFALSTVLPLPLKSRSLTPKLLFTVVPLSPVSGNPVPALPTFSVLSLTVPVTLVCTASVGAKSSTVALLSSISPCSVPVITRVVLAALLSAAAKAVL